MNTDTASLLGQYLSTTGLVHAEKDCSTGGSRRYRNNPITAEDLAYWAETDTTMADFTICHRCH